VAASTGRCAVSQSPVRPSGWAAELYYASGPNAGLPTKVRPSPTTQAYGIHPQRAPSAVEANYVLHSADALLAAFELHGVTNWSPTAFTCEDTVLAVHRPPLGGVIVVTDADSSNFLWYSQGSEG